MKRKYLIALGGMIVLIAVAILALAQVRSVRSGPGDRTATPSGPVTPDNTALLAFPTMTEMAPTDLAPQVAISDKVEIVIRHKNGELDSYLLATDMVDAFIDQLPAGDSIKYLIPPASLVGHEPPTITPESGN